MKLAVIGATGVLGRQILPRLAERGHIARAVVRGERDAILHRRLGFETAIADILEPQTLVSAIQGCEVVINIATAAPRAGEAPRSELNNCIRSEGARNLVAACEQAGVRRLIQQSIAFVLGDGDRLVDEAAPIVRSPRNTATAAMEEAIRRSGLNWIVLRGGALYGPHTGWNEFWIAQAKAGALVIPGDGSSFISPIHTYDFAEAFITAAESSIAGEILNIVDDHPVRQAEFFRYIAARHGGPDPQNGGPPGLPSFRVSNDKAKVMLNWKPLVASYRSGLA